MSAPPGNQTAPNPPSPDAPAPSASPPPPSPDAPPPSDSPLPAPKESLAPESGSPPPASSPPPEASPVAPTTSPPAPPPRTNSTPPGSRSPPSKAFSPPPPHKGSTSPPSPASSDNGLNSSQMNFTVGTTIGVGLLVIAIIIICVAWRKRRRKDGGVQYYDNDGGQYYENSKRPNWHNNPQTMSNDDMSGNDSGPYGPALPPPPPGIAFGFNTSTFTYDELAAATGGFAQANLLGQGGFGYVHKGVLPNGKEIAVKSLKSGSGQGEREFQAEVDIISRVHHRHLVSLVGYCIAGGQRMLVYQFVPNRTLEYHLHGKGLPVMDWTTRLRIALGSAKGLAYLHEDCHPRIIHRDIKSANILLDFNFEALVADFGLAKLSSDSYTHVSTRVMGTFGYLAPEYASSGKLTEKSDVFSFGVMLLELITGKKPVDPTSAMEDSLVDWARPLLSLALENGNLIDLVDPMLENNYNPQEMQRMVACAAASIRHSARKRPKMSQIIRALEGDVSLDDLNEGIRPANSSVIGSNGSSDYDAGSYNSDMKRFRQVALSSQEFVSSEHGTSSNDSRETTHVGNQRNNS